MSSNQLLPAGRRVFGALAAFFIGTLPAGAQTPAIATGTITGRVQDGTAQLALENARVTIVGSNREAFTNAFGNYRLTDVPAGELTLRVFYTGLVPQNITLTVAAGESTQRDVSLVGARAAGAAKSTDGVVKLDEFIVATAREDNASALAINEQRFSANIKSVVATDAFGNVNQNNLGEFLKFLPGVDYSYDTATVGLRGMPGSLTNISMDGSDIVNANGTSGERSVIVQVISLNNTSRVEITKVPTPDQPASSIGGSINLISASAFERNRPEFRFATLINMNSYEATFGARPGQGEDSDTEKVYHNQPDFNFIYTVPISKTFGVSINGAKANQFSYFRQVTRTINTATTAANPRKATFENPYVQTYNLNNFPVFERRNAIGGRLDWRPFPLDTISLSYSGSYYRHNYTRRHLIINAGTNPVSWGPNFTHGAAGAGSVNQDSVVRFAHQRLHNLALNYRHVGSQWNVTGFLGYSRAMNMTRHLSHEAFENASARLTGLTINLDDFDYYLPGTITARNAAGPVNIFDLGNYTLSNRTASLNRTGHSISKSGKFDVTRKFFTAGLNASFKTGLSSREEARQAETYSFFPVYLGPDGRANSGDELARLAPIDVLNAGAVDDRWPRNFHPVQYLSSHQFYDIFQQYPQYWDLNANRRTDLANAMNAANNMNERIDAAYLMGDVSLLQNRLRIVAGVRFEKTTASADVVLADQNAKYRHEANGNLILDAAKKPILITTDLIAQDALVIQPLGAHPGQKYHGYYPSINASFNVQENLIARVGLARSLARPNFGNLFGATTVTTTDFDPASLATGSALGTIITKNPNLKPWTADSLDLRLEYYTKAGGEFSVGFFRKQIKDFFGTKTFLATPEFLQSVDLSEEYVDYQVTAPYNVAGLTHITGWEFNANQPLSALGGFWRHFRVFANATFVRNKGTAEADFRGFNPLQVNWGFRFIRGRLTVDAKVNLLAHKRVGIATAAAYGGPAWTYWGARLRFDPSLDYRINRRCTFFASARNLFNDRDRVYSYTDGSPDYVKFQGETDFGVNFQFGIKGNF